MATDVLQACNDQEQELITAFRGLSTEDQGYALRIIGRRYTYTIKDREAAGLTIE